MEFEWDEGNIDKNLKHNVHDWEVEEAAVDLMAFVEGGRVVRGERRYVLFGRTQSSGRYLKVVFTIRMRNSTEFMRPISAVEMTAREKRRYQRP